MRSSAILRKLPALPPKADWSKHFPLTAFNVVNRLSSYGGNKSGKRTNVVDPVLAEEIIHSLDIGKATHVVEAYPGMGGLTRALLSQPPSIVTKVTAVEPAAPFRKNGLGTQEPDEYLSREERVGQAWKQLTVKDRISRSEHAALDDRENPLEPGNLPNCEEDEDIDSMLEHTSDSIHPPAGVVTDKKGSGLLEQLRNEAVDPHDRSTPSNSNPPNTSSLKQSKSLDRLPDFLTIWPSSLDDRLDVIDDTMYDWATFTKLDQMHVFQDVEAKSWNEASPNLRFVAQIPESDLGEQLVAQWIGCVANQSWFFKYGRVQLSLIVRPTLYDRLTALPGTKAYCKLSVMRAALCDYRPATDSYLNLSLQDTMSEVQLSRLQRLDREKLVPRPLTLVAGAGAGVSKVKGISIGKSSLTDILARYPDFAPLPAKKSLNQDPLLDRGKQESLSDCYYPKLKRNKREGSRPGMMALTLQPKKSPWIDKYSKDVWDYVLRRMFVMQGSVLEMAIKNLGLGATNLLPQLTGDKLPPEQKVDPTKLVREFSLQDWSNIVRAFSNWKFAPDVLLLGSVTQAEEGSSRMLGSGM